MPSAEPSFYFALPRLLAYWNGRSSVRSEQNGFEARTIGALMHGVVYATAAHYLLADLPLAWQAVLLLPLAFAVWLGWVLLLYLNAVIIGLARSVGVMRDLPDARAQSVLVGIFTTLCAVDLVARGTFAWLGLTWLVLLVMNLLAALALRVLEDESVAA